MGTMNAADRCPKCKSTEVSEVDNDLYGDGDWECSNCGHVAADHEFWPSRAEIGLSLTHCEVCCRVLTWGCGHSNEQEIEAIRHRDTEEHKTGRCWHYDHANCDPKDCKLAGTSVDGYAAFVTHQEQAAKMSTA